MDVASNHNKWEDDSGPPGGGGGGRRPMRMAGEGGGGGNVPFSKMVFDGKRMRKAIQRRTVDYNHSVARWMQVRLNKIYFYFLNKKAIIVFIVLLIAHCSMFLFLLFL